MANKKLKVELDVDTSKAKGKVKRDLAEASAPSGGSSAVSIATKESAASVKLLGDAARNARTNLASAATAMSKAASTKERGLDEGAGSAEKSVRGLGYAARETQINMKRAAKAFTGIAVGLAANYAAKNMEAGSTGQKVVEYGASAVSGASMGAMVAGPIGAAIGGLAGVLKTYLDKGAANQSAIDDYRRGEEKYAQTREWSKHIQGITGIGEIKQTDFIKDNKERLEAELKDVQDHLSKTKEHIKILNSGIANIKGEIEAMQRDGKTDTEEYKKLVDQLQESRYKLQALESAEDQLAKQEHGIKVSQSKETPGIDQKRESLTGTDMMQRIGGGSGEAGGRSLMTRLQEDGNRLLKDIANNTKTGGATWQ